MGHTVLRSTPINFNFSGAGTQVSLPTRTGGRTTNVFIEGGATTEGFVEVSSDKANWFIADDGAGTALTGIGDGIHRNISPAVWTRLRFVATGVLTLNCLIDVEKESEH